MSITRTAEKGQGVAQGLCAPPTRMAVTRAAGEHHRGILRLLEARPRMPIARSAQVHGTRLGAHACRPQGKRTDGRGLAVHGNGAVIGSAQGWRHRRIPPPACAGIGIARLTSVRWDTRMFKAKPLLSAPPRVVQKAPVSGQVATSVLPSAANWPFPVVEVKLLPAVFPIQTANSSTLPLISMMPK